MTATDISMIIISLGLSSLMIALCVKIVNDSFISRRNASKQIIQVEDHEDSEDHEKYRPLDIAQGLESDLKNLRSSRYGRDMFLSSRRNDEVGSFHSHHTRTSTPNLGNFRKRK